MVATIRISTRPTIKTVVMVIVVYVVLTTNRRYIYTDLIVVVKTFVVFLTDCSVPFRKNTCLIRK